MILTLLFFVLGTLALSAQSLPVKVYAEGRQYRGDTRNVVVRVGNSRIISLVSAYKLGGRPWADAVFRSDTRDGRTSYISRAYDCARGTMRALGEGASLATMSVATKPRDAAERPVPDSGIERAMARYACGL